MASSAMDEKSQGRPPPPKEVKAWVHFVAGGFAGMAGATCTCPFDVVKTRLQSDQHKALSAIRNQRVGLFRSGWYHVTDTFGIISSIYRVEGWRALFRGLGPNLAGVIPARSVNFFTYGLSKPAISEYFGYHEHDDAPAYVHLMAGVSAGIVTSTVTNPIWLVKTRLQLDRAGARQYRNSMDCFQKILKAEGFTALYRGLSASYLGTAESSIQWTLYEQMRKFIRKRDEHRHREGGHVPNVFANWCATSGAAGLAKLLASLITYPHEVVRTRLRQAPVISGGRPKYTGLIQCFRLVIHEEGLASMYGGLTPHLLRTVPNSIIMFGTWDLIIRSVS